MRPTAALVLLLIASTCASVSQAPGPVPPPPSPTPTSGPALKPGLPSQAAGQTRRKSTETPGPDADQGTEAGQAAPAPRAKATPPRQAAGAAGPVTAPTPVARQYTIEGFSYRKLLGRDAIRPVYAPEYVAADQAGYQPNELVLGVCVQGDCRAYPIGILNWREMVNDELGGVPILATW